VQVARRCVGRLRAPQWLDTFKAVHWERIEGCFTGLFAMDTALVVATKLSTEGALPWELFVGCLVVMVVETEGPNQNFPERERN
jgi:hypothetical protein